MIGVVLLIWGWVLYLDGFVVLFYYCVVVLMELVVCQLYLCLIGELVLGGSCSILYLYCGVCEMLQFQVICGLVDVDLMVLFKFVQIEFCYFFVLYLENIVMLELVMLDVVSVVNGVVVGKVGLCLYLVGVGFQWFCEIEIELVMVLLQLYDLVFGQQWQILKMLLLVMMLVYWSLD